MAEWYIYALGIFAGGVALLLVYAILRNQNIIGSIPILSGIIDPLLDSTLSSHWSRSRDWNTKTLNKSDIKWSRKPVTWDEIPSTNEYELDNDDVNLDYFNVYESTELYSGKPKPNKDFKNGSPTEYPFVMMHDDEAYLVRTSGADYARYVIKVEDWQPEE